MPNVTASYESFSDLIAFFVNFHIVLHVFSTFKGTSDINPQIKVENLFF